MADSARRFTPHKALVAHAALFAALLGVWGCLDDGPRSAPGTLTAVLESPNGAEGAALIHLVGGGVSRVEPLTGDLHTSAAGDTTKVVVLLGTPGEVAFRLNVADTTQPPATTVVQVADGQNAVRDGLAGYQVRYTP